MSLILYEIGSNSCIKIHELKKFRCFQFETTWDRSINYWIIYENIHIHVHTYLYIEVFKINSA